MLRAYRRASLPKYVPRPFGCLAALIASALLVPGAAAGSHATRPTRALLGDTAVESQHRALIAGRSEAFRLHAHASGLAGRLRLYVDARSTATRVVVGLYRDLHGRPGALLATSSIPSPRRGAWNTVTLLRGPRLVASNPYWLTVLGEGGTLRYRARRHGHCRSAASLRANLSALPSAWSAGRIVRHAHCPISAYATTALSGAPGVPARPVSVIPPVISALPPGSAPLGAVILPGSPPPPPPGEHTPPPAPPANSGLPTIGGTLVVGEVLSSTRGAWSGSPSAYAYQWQDCNPGGNGCTNISGAGASGYTLAAADVGHTLRAVVTATNKGGSTPASSQASGIVAAYASGPPYPPCTQTLSQGANVTSAVSGAAATTVICLNSGEYGSLTLNGAHTGDVTLQAAPKAHVTAGKLTLEGSHIVVRGLWLKGEVALEEGASFVTIDRNDITGGGEGIVFDTSDCTVPNAPTWAGCEPHAPITDITIFANHIHDIGEGGGEDAIHLDNWRRVKITGNEFDHIVEAGEHTDCVQSVYGGDQLSFDHNYEHDNDCQGFFVKDGDATNVSFADNLFLRDQIGSFANFAQVWNVQGLTIQRNTIWDGKGFALVAEGASFTPTATIDHNVINIFKVSQPIGNAYSITEGNDIFGEPPTNLTEGSGDSVVASPSFTNTAIDDYRLAGNPNGVGIDWSPSGQQYGPAG
jgi:hypothetical protein